MNAKELEMKLRTAVEEYIAGEETYDDNSLLCIDPHSLDVEIVDSDEPEDVDKDYIEVMELVNMRPDKPGEWIADNDAIAELAKEYV